MTNVRVRTTALTFGVLLPSNDILSLMLWSESNIFFYVYNVSFIYCNEKEPIIATHFVWIARYQALITLLVSPNGFQPN